MILSDHLFFREPPPVHDAPWPADTFRRAVLVALGVAAAFSALWVVDPGLRAMLLAFGLTAGLSAALAPGATTRPGPVLSGQAVSARASADGPLLPDLVRLVDAMPTPAFAVDGSGTILVANEQARSAFDVEGGVGQSWKSRFRHADGPLYKLTRGLRGTTVFRRVDLALRNGPQDTEQAFRIATLSETPPVFLVVAEENPDVTARNLQAMQNQKMQAIGQLAGGIAHDFNNLLTAIAGHSDLLLLRHDRDDPDYPDLMQITQNANRAAALVQQLLAFSRKQKLKPTAINVRETISDMSHLLGRLVGAQITLNVSHRDAGACIRMDKRSLEQILMNLVVNARDAMPDGGRIDLETEFRSYDRDWTQHGIHVPPGDYVRITVRDTGTGIDPAVLDSIIEPFFTTKKAGDGTGLGLSTVHGIVRQSGGFIFPYSTPGKGTEFRMYFPVAKGRVTADADPTPREPSRSLRKSGDAAVILLVEDEAPVRAFTKRALELSGHKVIEVASGDDALTLLSDGVGADIRLIVTDVIMPGLDGPAWVTRARKSLPDVPVLFLSGYSDDAMAARIEETGKSEFLQKPFSLKDLTDQVQLMLA